MERNTSLTVLNGGVPHGTSAAVRAVFLHQLSKFFPWKMKIKYHLNFFRAVSYLVCKTVEWFSELIQVNILNSLGFHRANSLKKKDYYIFILKKESTLQPYIPAIIFWKIFLQLFISNWLYPYQSNYLHYLTNCFHLTTSIQPSLTISFSPTLSNYLHPTASTHQPTSDCISNCLHPTVSIHPSHPSTCIKLYLTVSIQQFQSNNFHLTI